MLETKISEDNIKNDFPETEREVDNRIQPTQDMIQWRYFKERFQEHSHTVQSDEYPTAS
jgi:hypothetical protein